MAINLKTLAIMVFAGVMGSAQGQSSIASEQLKYFTIRKIRVEEISKDVLGNNLARTINEKHLKTQFIPGREGYPQEEPKTGKVISTARDLVALGEDVYKLVIKGRPSNKTNYAPISVLPRMNGTAVDIFDTEGWSAPVKRTYRVVYENLYGAEVVNFSYSLIFAYKGTYNGAGAYLTAVQIIPETVRTLFGFDFTANMKLGGIINQGSRQNPIAGATLLLEYTVSTIMVTQNQVDTLFVNGRGAYNKL
jgi:hypothetical protein